MESTRVALPIQGDAVMLISNCSNYSLYRGAVDVCWLEELQMWKPQMDLWTPGNPLSPQIHAHIAGMFNERIQDMTHICDAKNMVVDSGIEFLLTAVIYGPLRVRTMGAFTTGKY